MDRAVEPRESRAFCRLSLDGVIDGSGFRL